jgi:hypothetical protein
MDRCSRARTWIGFALAALLLTVVLVGCGGGSSTAAPSSKAATVARSPSGTQTSTVGRQTSAPKAALSRHQLAVKAEAICTHLELELVVAVPKSANMTEIVRVVPGRAASEQRAVQQLRELTPPASLAHDWRLIISYRQTLANELAALAKAAKQKDSAAIKKLGVSKKQEHSLLLAAAKRAGLYKCGIIG